jgi:hypothetical protein
MKSLFHKNRERKKMKENCGIYIEVPGGLTLRAQAERAIAEKLGKSTSTKETLPDEVIGKPLRQKTERRSKNE